MLLTRATCGSLPETENKERKASAERDVTFNETGDEQFCNKINDLVILKAVRMRQVCYCSNTWHVPLQLYYFLINYSVHVVLLDSSADISYPQTFPRIWYSSQFSFSYRLRASYKL